MTNLPHIPPRRLVFSGGGIRILAYLGALEFLEEKRMLTNLREVCGVSAGAMSCGDFVLNMISVMYDQLNLKLRFFLWKHLV